MSDKVLSAKDVKLRMVQALPLRAPSPGRYGLLEWRKERLQGSWLMSSQIDEGLSFQREGRIIIAQHGGFGVRQIQVQIHLCHAQGL